MAAAGFRTTKGLYFTFTLLCLVCLASSLKDKDQLVNKLSIARENNETFICKHNYCESPQMHSLEIFLICGCFNMFSI